MSQKLAIEQLLDDNQNRDLLRFSTAGSVDDGKSTLIGRLLHDSKSIFEDTLTAIMKSSKDNQFSEEIDFSLLTDGLKAEREQKITIDVAYRYFSTPKRNFILADTPGHEQYTRNMATGASTADAAVVLIDAKKGVSTQTKRHSFILSLLGVRHIIVAINKMDLVNYDQTVFENICQEYQSFASRLNFASLNIIPVSALLGDNVVNTSDQMPWYNSQPLLQVLENVYVDGRHNLVDLRIPIQGVLRPHQEFRGFTGQLVSGAVQEGDEVLVLPSMKSARVKTLESFDGPNLRVFAPMSTVLTLDREIDISRGDLICTPNNIPHQSDELDAMIIWMSNEPMKVGKSYVIMHSTVQSRGIVTRLNYQVDINSLRKKAADCLEINTVGRISFLCNRTLFFDSYDRNPGLGSFILIDPISNETLGAGMMTEKGSDDDWKSKLDSSDLAAVRNITKEKSLISEIERTETIGNSSRTIWLTGLSGSGKSTIAAHLERRLFDKGLAVYCLDGDNLRFGLNRDLGFSIQDRQENIRRVAEVAKLLNQARVIVIASLISPLQADRDQARKIIGPNHYIEVFVNAPLKTCESRDPKGLYKKARAGEIQEFTGIDSPYEEPDSCDLMVPSDQWSVEQSVNAILDIVYDT